MLLCGATHLQQPRYGCTHWTPEHATPRHATALAWAGWAPAAQTAPAPCTAQRPAGAGAPAQRGRPGRPAQSAERRRAERWLGVTPSMLSRNAPRTMSKPCPPIQRCLATAQSTTHHSVRGRHQLKGAGRHTAVEGGGGQQAGTGAGAGIRAGGLCCNQALQGSPVQLKALPEGRQGEATEMEEGCFLACCPSQGPRPCGCPC